MTRQLAAIVVTAGIALGAVIAPVQPARAHTMLRVPTPLPVPAPRLRPALSIPSPVCTVAGWLSGLAGTLCSVARKGGELLSAGGKLAGSAGTVAKVAGIATVLTGLAAWVTGAGRAVLTETASVIGASTRPQLQSAWFSASYWRMAAIGMLLTLPFLFAACVQGLLRSDPSLIGRAALAYLPLAVLGISIAAPLTTLLLSASDGLSTLIAGAAGQAPGVALGKLGTGTTLLAGVSGSFIAFVIGFVTVAATLTLWVELLVRAAAVYVVVLMLPVVFAALVWPARRVWAIRSVELLVALILAKFAIVAVLSLGGTAIGHDMIPGPAAALVGVTLVMLAAFSPWALLRLLPLHEMAAGVEGLGPQLSRRVPMFDRPAGEAASEPTPWPNPSSDRASEPTFDAAQTAVGGLDGDGPAAGAGDGPSISAHGEPPGSGEEVVPHAGGAMVTPGSAGGAVSAAGESSASEPAAAPRPPVPTQAEVVEGERERLPGMAPMWQEKNGDWPTIVLGPPESPAQTGAAPKRTPQALPAIPKTAMPPGAPHPLAPADPPNPDAGDV